MLLSLLTYNQWLRLADADKRIESLQLSLETAESKPLVVENVLVPLCKEQQTVDRIVTQTVTKIKEVPYVVETCSCEFPADVVSLLDETYYQLDLRRATGTPAGESLLR